MEQRPLFFLNPQITDFFWFLPDTQACFFQTPDYPLKDLFDSTTQGGNSWGLNVLQVLGSWVKEESSHDASQPIQRQSSLSWQSSSSWSHPPPSIGTMCDEEEEKKSKSSHGCLVCVALQEGALGLLLPCFSKSIFFSHTYKPDAKEAQKGNVTVLKFNESVLTPERWTQVVTTG